jgi:hypothetical protein
MEDKPQIKNNYKKILMNRNKECYIERDKYITILQKKKKK